MACHAEEDRLQRCGVPIILHHFLIVCSGENRVDGGAVLVGRCGDGATEGCYSIERCFKPGFATAIKAAMLRFGSLRNRITTTITTTSTAFFAIFHNYGKCNAVAIAILVVRAGLILKK